jgi:hypothetical protein
VRSSGLLGSQRFGRSILVARRAGAAQAAIEIAASSTATRKN